VKVTRKDTAGKDAAGKDATGKDDMTKNATGKTATANDDKKTLQVIAAKSEAGSRIQVYWAAK